MTHLRSRSRRMLSRTFDASALRLILLLLLLLPAISHTEELVWQQLTAEAPWSPRVQHSVTFHAGRFFLIGGTTGGPRLNDVWVSETGAEWSRILAEAPFPTRCLHTVVSWKSHLLLIGGDHIPFLLDDLWTSRTGDEWIPVYQSSMLNRFRSGPIPTIPTAPFAPRMSHTLTIFQDCLVMLGGMERTAAESRMGASSDVWTSDDGKTWCKNSDAGAWGPRYGHAVTVVGTSMFLTGGEVRDEHNKFVWSNDVWRSDDVSTWERVCTAPWAAREGHVSVSVGDSLFVVGGLGKNVYSDVWISSNGKSWREVGTLPLARGRDYFAGVVVGDKLFIFGGEAAGGEKLSDVWVADLTPVLTLKTDPQE